jgi:hypothetical protein
MTSLLRNALLLVILVMMTATLAAMASAQVAAGVLSPDAGEALAFGLVWCQIFMAMYAFDLLRDQIESLDLQAAWNGLAGVVITLMAVSAAANMPAEFAEPTLSIGLAFGLVLWAKGAYCHWR